MKGETKRRHNSQASQLEIPSLVCSFSAHPKTKRNRDETSIETGIQQSNVNNQKPALHQTTSKSRIHVCIGNNEITLLDFKAAQKVRISISL